MSSFNKTRATGKKGTYIYGQGGIKIKAKPPKMPTQPTLTVGTFVLCMLVLSGFFLAVFLLTGCSAFDPYQYKTPVPSTNIAIVASKTARLEKTLTPTSVPINSCQVEVDEALNLRVGPGMDYAIIDWLFTGDSLIIIEEQGTWLHVSDKTQSGWIHKNYCTKEKENENK